MSGPGVRRLVRALLLAAAVVGAYLPALGCGFVFDDHETVERNPLVTGHGRWRDLLITSRMGSRGNLEVWRPLTFLSYAINRRVGSGPFWYHAVNVALHLGVVLVLDSLLLAVVPEAALAASLVFALHPIHTEAVTSVVGRGELFAAAAALLHVALVTRGGAGIARGVLAGFVLLFGMLGKETAIAGLPMAAAWLWLRPGADRGAVPSRAEWGWRLLPGTTAVAVYFALRRAATGAFASLLVSVSPLNNPLVLLPAGKRAIAATALAFRSLALQLWPAHLSATYSRDAIALTTSPAAPDFLAGLLSTLGLAVVAVTLVRRAPAAAMGLIWYLVALLPVSNLVNVLPTVFAERLLYLPSIGLCLALGAGLVKLLPRRWPILLALVSLGFAARTFLRSTEWRSDLSLFASAVQVVPRSAVANMGLGEALLAAGRAAEAVEPLAVAVEIAPPLAQAWDLLGRARLASGDLPGAVFALRAATRLDPLDLRAAGHLAEAERAWKVAPRPSR